jgi:hypothetical protein
VNTLTVNGGTGSSEELRSIRTKMAAADAAARQYWNDPTWRREMAANITTTVYEGFQHENLLRYMATVENVEMGDRIFMEEVRGLEVFWVSMGGQIDQSSITEDIWELPRDYVGFHVTELEEKLESGFSRTSANIVSLAIEQMDAAINARLLRLFQAAIPDGSSPYYIAAAGLSLAALNTSIAEVQDESRSDVVSIIGRSTMTGQIIDELADLNGFTPETNEDMLRNGRLGLYRGANIIRLRNFRNAVGASYVPANELYVVGIDAAKVGFWGGLRAQEWSEQGGFYWHYMGRRTAGFAVRKPEHVRRIVDTSITP